MVLPLRDEGAISLGLSNLPGLFMGSLALTLVAAPVSTLVFSLPNLSKGKVITSFRARVNKFINLAVLLYTFLIGMGLIEKVPSFFNYFRWNNQRK